MGEDLGQGDKEGGATLECQECSEGKQKSQHSCLQWNLRFQHFRCKSDDGSSHATGLLVSWSILLMYTLEYHLPSITRTKRNTITRVKKKKLARLALGNHWRAHWTEVSQWAHTWSDFKSVAQWLWYECVLSCYDVLLLYYMQMLFFFKMVCHGYLFFVVQKYIWC